MKKYMYVLLISLLTLGSAIAYGQQLEPQQKLGYFSAMEVGKNCKVELRPGEAGLAIPKTNNNTLRYYINDGKLIIESSQSDKISNMIIWLPSHTLETIELFGNAMIFSSQKVKINYLKIIARDRSVVRLNLDVEDLNVKAY